MILLHISHMQKAISHHMDLILQDLKSRNYKSNMVMVFNKKETNIETAGIKYLSL